MAESKGNIEKVNPATLEVDGETIDIAAGAVESVTTTVPSEADATSAPSKLSEDVNRPPVSTNDPEVPIAHSLVAGAGASTGPPKIHPETHVASNAYLSEEDKKAGNVQWLDKNMNVVDKDPNEKGK